MVQSAIQDVLILATQKLQLANTNPYIHLDQTNLGMTRRDLPYFKDVLSAHAYATQLFIWYPCT